MDQEKKQPLLTAAVYDRLKFLVQIALPGAGTLYFALAALWQLPAAEQVVGSVAALSVFLGLFIEYAKRRFEASDVATQGEVFYTNDPNAKRPILVSYDEPVANYIAEGKSEIRLKLVEGSTELPGE